MLFFEKIAAAIGLVCLLLSFFLLTSGDPELISKTYLPLLVLVVCAIYLIFERVRGAASTGVGVVRGRDGFTRRNDGKGNVSVSRTDKQTFHE